MGSGDVQDLLSVVVSGYLAGLMSLDEAARAVKEILSSVEVRVVEVPNVDDYCIVFGLDCSRVDVSSATKYVFHTLALLVENFAGIDVGEWEDDMIYELADEVVDYDVDAVRFECLLSDGCEAVLFLRGPYFAPYNAYVLGKAGDVELLAGEIDAFRRWARSERLACYKFPTKQCVQEWRHGYTEA